MLFKYYFSEVNIYSYTTYISYVAISDNCAYLLFDQNKSRVTTFDSISSKYMEHYHKPKSNQFTVSKYNVVKEICTPNILEYSEDIIQSVRRYLAIKNTKIVIVLDFFEELRTKL